MSASFYAPCEKCGINVPIQVIVDKHALDGDGQLYAISWDWIDMWAHCLIHQEGK